MTRYALSRLALLPVMLFVVSFLSFAILYAAPGSAAASLIDPTNPASQAEVEHRLGLDRPFFVQYGSWLAGAIQGNFGQSYINNRPVIGEFTARIGLTLEIAIVAVVFSLLIGVGAALVAARFRGRWIDRAIMACTTLGVCLPSFLVATLLVLFFSLYIPAYPVISFTPLSRGLAANARSVLLPALALAIPAAATFCRYVRAAAEDIMRDADYVRTAKAKGVKPFATLTKHVLPNALVPLTTVAGLQFGYLIGGSVLIETVFALPGVGTRLLQGITERDTPVVQAGVLLIAVVFVVVTFVVDLLYPLLDPRIRIRSTA